VFSERCCIFSNQKCNIEEIFKLAIRILARSSPLSSDVLKKSVCGVKVNSRLNGLSLLGLFSNQKMCRLEFS